MINQGRALFSRVLPADTEIQKKPLKKNTFPITFDDPEFPGLPLGAYDEKRKELVKERNLDYNKYLEQKEKQEEFKRYARKLQSEFGIILPDPIDFTTSYNMLTSNIFGFAPPPYGQHSNGLLSYDPKQSKEEYRQALQQQIDDQKKRKEMEKLQDMQNSQKQPLYQPSFIDGSAHRRPYLMQQSGGMSQTTVSPSMSVDSLEEVSPTAIVPQQVNTFPVMPHFPQAVATSLNANSGLLFESESTKVKDKEFYREDLRRQIEEKKRREEEEKARLRMEEECLALRVEQQRLRMLQEYENERQKKLQKEEELRRKQERLWQLQEQQRKEAEDSRHLLYKRKLGEAEKERNKINNSDVTAIAVPTSTLQAPSAKSEIPSPPVDSRSQVLSQLSLIRQQLHEEKKQKKEMLYQKKTYQVMDRADDDDDPLSPTSYNAELGDVN